MCQDRQVAAATDLQSYDDDARLSAAGSCCAPVIRGLSVARATSLAATFKALADPTRLRLLSLIAEGEGNVDGGSEGKGVCVCDLVGCFAVSAPTISHHLKVLRDAGLVDSQRRGTWVYYRLTPHARSTLAAIVR
ncbi:MAG: winged helix-turn-helix transcriptional regulator [Austwickia sp.]|jgi:ArsR family transcriptional regulator|nr:winged helix-turn-helix transcriptional regulator [Austwickia sp.]MBK9102844.1 winged helix-turn-helix transcriptional regulator [Austwickia sp.]